MFNTEKGGEDEMLEGLHNEASLRIVQVLLRFNRKRSDGIEEVEWQIVCVA